MIILHLNNYSMECHPKGVFKDIWFTESCHCIFNGSSGGAVSTAEGLEGTPRCLTCTEHPGDAIDADVRWRLFTLPLTRGPFSGHVVAFLSLARNSEGVLIPFNTIQII